jgi:ABC-type uncharacterized transport system permease subunit
MDILQILLSESFWSASIRIATPLIFGVLGALICEKSGVLNLGIEGIFVAGAMVGWLAVWLGAGLWGGVLRPLDIPLLSDLPFIGPILFQQTALTFLALFCVAVVWYIFNKTALGVALKAVGDNPNSVDAQGLSVYALRIGAVMAGSALMALGGAFLTMSAFDAFFFGMVNGRGWICIALVIFASWRPGKALLGAVLFGAFDALQVRLQTEVGGSVPSQVFLAAPYVLSIIALVIAARSADYPRALLTPWFKGQR